MMRARLILHGVLGALPLLSAVMTARAQSLPPYVTCTVGRARLLTSENGLRGGAVGDFDRSRSPDLALLDRDNLVIVRTDSNLFRLGMCTEAVTASTIAAQRPLAVGVIDVDATLDLALLQASASTKNAALLIGDGSGAFVPGATTQSDALSDPRALAVGTIDQNSRPDLVIGDANTLAVMLGPESTSVAYTVSQRLALGNNPVQEVGLADFSGDGQLDIASVDFGGTVRIFAQTAAGTFDPTPLAQRALDAGASPQDMQIAESDVDDPDSLPPLNGDEHPDIVFLSINESGAGELQVFLGQAGGAVFTVRNPIPAGADPAALALGDFNLDGNLDAAVADAAGAEVLFFLGDGTGALNPAGVRPTGSTPGGILVANIDDDAFDDLITTNTDGTITIFLSSDPPPTSTPTATHTDLPTATDTATPTPTDTPSPTPNATDTRTPTRTRTPENTRTVTETPITPGVFAVQGEGCAHIGGGGAGLADAMPLLVLGALGLVRRVASRRRPRS